MRRGPKLKTVYVFDWEGNFIESMTTKEVSEKYRIVRGALSACITRGNCFDYKYYFSYNKNFIPNINRKSAHSVTSRFSFGTVAGISLPPFVDLNELSF